MNLRPRRMEDPEVNLISLIDVVLMLVIFFMLSSSFIDEGRVRVHLPGVERPDRVTDDKKALVVTVTRQGSYRVDEQELINSSRETLRAAIVKSSGGDRERPVTLRADGQATHQAVITAMDVLGRLGFAEVNVATVGAEAPAPPGGGKRP
jgi:biopolymer transport protein ExbD